MEYCRNTTISKNYIYDNDESIFLGNSHNNFVIGNTAYSGSGCGIYLEESNKNIVKENIANHNTGGDGIYLSDSNNNIVSDNTASYNWYNGILLWDSNGNNTITGNTANYNHESGIYLGALCDDNTISKNRVNNNNDNGISIRNADHNVISYNIAKNNYYGIYLIKSNYNTISGNDVLENSICIIESDCKGNIFRNNGFCTYGTIIKELIILITIIGWTTVISTIIFLGIRRKRAVS